MDLFRLLDPGPFDAPIVVIAFDAWVDAGSASITAADQLAAGAPVVATLDGDAIFDYRSRRPTLEIVDGRPRELTWPELTVRRVRIAGRDVLVLSGAEPDYRWNQLADEAVAFARRVGAVEWISIGAIPAAVPHTRPVSILGTASWPGLLRGKVEPGPEGTLRVPAACLSVLDMAVARAGFAAIGYYAQVPHYITGAYPAASVALLKAIGWHVGADVPVGDLQAEADALRVRLDAATAVDDTTRAYVERLEAQVDEARLPSGTDLIADIERFLRDRGNEGAERG
ncbi:MAG: PAC2 family protein [Chloroflexota bacterium]